MKVGFGIVTCERPDEFSVLADSIETHLSDLIDDLYIYQDGGRPYVFQKNERVNVAYVAATNRGVAIGKNWLLNRMLNAECDWIFLAEDDLVVTDPQAITGYIAAAEQSGLHHLMFHGHGDGNLADPVSIDGPVTTWPNYVGAYCLYSRECLLDVGLLDEHFHNAMEHVEHTLRLAEAEWTTPWQGAADATGSENWLAEQDVDSVLCYRPDWQANISAARDYWRGAYPSTYPLVFQR
jgi:GT2 family glycosyltransferase